MDIIHEQTRRAFEPNVPAQGASSGESYTDELAKLAKLKDDGVITPDEFNAKKAQILGL